MPPPEDIDVTATQKMMVADLAERFADLALAAGLEAQRLADTGHFSEAWVAIGRTKALTECCHAAMLVARNL